jgi:hypothetical protein
MTEPEQSVPPIADPSGSPYPRDAPGQEAEPPGTGKAVGMAPIVSCAIWLALFGLDFAVLGFVVPSFEAMFKDMGKELPATTQAVLSLSRFVRYPPGTMWAGLVILASIGILWAPVKRGIRVTIYSILSAAAVLFLGFIALSIFLPLIGTIQSVGGR